MKLAALFAVLLLVLLLQVWRIYEDAYAERWVAKPCPPWEMIEDKDILGKTYYYCPDWP